MSNLIKLLVYNDYKLTKKAIEKNKDNIGFIDNDNDETVLIRYLKFNKNPNLNIIKLLEKEKNISDAKYETPLMYYCENYYLENLNKKIIKYFSNQIRLKSCYYKTALMYYLEYNKNPSIDIIKLLEKEKNIFGSNDTPFMSYCKNTKIENLNPEIIEYFSDQFNNKNYDSETALMYYLQFNKNPSIDIVKLFKEIKKVFSNYNTTPLMFYCMNRYINNLNPKIIEYFSDQIGINNIYKATSLMYYLQHNKNPSIDIIKLLEKEIIICYKNNYNIILYYLYNHTCNQEILKYFYYNFGYKDIKYYDTKIDLDIY